MADSNSQQQRPRGRANARHASLQAAAAAAAAQEAANEAAMLQPTSSITQGVAHLGLSSNVSVASSNLSLASITFTDSASGGDTSSVSGSIVSLVPAIEYPSKIGDLGTPINIVTNYVEMGRKNASLFQYRVDFCPPEDHTFAKKQLLGSQTRILGAHLFDGSMVYKTERLGDESLRFDAVNLNNKVFRISLRLVKMISSEDKEFIQFYNTVLRKCMSLMDMDELGRHFYDRSQSISIRDHGLDLWPGIITAIKAHDHGLLLCAEITHKVLRTNTVLDLIKNIYSKNPSERAHQIIAKELKGQVVITHYNKKTYRIDEVDFDSTPSATFKNSDDVETTYYDYYKDKYNLNIAQGDMKQPLLVSYPKKKDINKGMATNIYLIPSLCNLTGLSDDLRKNVKLMQQLAEHLHMDPVKRKKKLDEFMKNLSETPAVRKELSNWKIDFNPVFIRGQARVLPNQQIILRNNRNDEQTLVAPDFKADWTNHLKRNYMLSCGILKNWLMILPGENKEGIASFIEGMTMEARKLGMSVEPPMKIITYQSRRDGRDFDEMFMKREVVPFEKHLQFVIFILPDNNVKRYAEVKRFFILKFEVAVQCFLARNLTNRNLMSVQSKMMIQVNAKLGGVPWSLKGSPSSNTMILGYDVYHCAARRGVSVGALVATISSDLGKYFSTISFHKDKSELAQNMCEDMSRCLKAFEAKNGALPDNIFFFRDGVGEGQIQFVADHELKMVQSAMQTIYGANVPLPKFTFIIVTKKINTRFFMEKKENVMENPPHGSVLDTICTLPKKYDFFLVSQSVRQGTVSPTNYNIIHDTSGLNINRIQMASYKLCHLYFNWSGTVAVPAPCQYAHKLAYLTGVSVDEQAPLRLRDKLWYL